MLIALQMALLTLGATNVQARIIHGPPVGIAIGQTARVSAAVLPHAIRSYALTLSFYDEDGNLLGEFHGTIEPGKTISFDLNRDDLIREENRIEIHGVIEIPEGGPRDVVISQEVFNNSDGKTTASGHDSAYRFTLADANHSLITEPFGIAIGQTARVSALNFFDEYIETSVKFLDDDGNLLAELRGTIEPGKTMSFDLNRDDLIREQNRIEIHAVIEISKRDLRNLVLSQEVFNNEDGRTSEGIFVFRTLPPPF